MDTRNVVNKILNKTNPLNKAVDNVGKGYNPLNKASVNVVKVPKLNEHYKHEAKETPSKEAGEAIKKILKK